ncbi:hypothetical protein Nepgr_029782 [Nepenthes gracilis]|uniref:Uncharacterized protein n=1 Tax=Nepenthes gracilis TaxID=150966 RepID=A0AAD3TEY5_NEPGR|nr:hypothetical protein Nepgr_029782 [Nepenthes gracilis]
MELPEVGSASGRIQGDVSIKTKSDAIRFKATSFNVLICGHHKVFPVKRAPIQRCSLVPKLSGKKVVR